MIMCPNCGLVGKCFHVGRTGSNRVRCKKCRYEFQIAEPDYLRPEPLHWREAIPVSPEVDDD